MADRILISRRCLALLAALTAVPLGASSGALAQSPATGPAKAITVPVGFVRVEAGGRVALCARDEETWVKAALAQSPPATQATTQPADLLARVTEQKAAVKKALLSELNLTDPAAVAAAGKLFDEELPKVARDFAGFKAPVVYFVTTREGIKALMASGWSDPQLRYNRATGDVMFDMQIPISPESVAGEALLPAMYEPGGEIAKATTDLAGFVQKSEAGIAQSVAGRCHLMMQLKIIDFVQKYAIDPLALKPDQAWAGSGLADYFAAKTITTISGFQLLDLVKGMTADPNNAPVGAAGIDLVKPLPLEALRDEVKPYYVDARRRKAAAIIFILATEGGADAPAKLLAAMKKSPATDNVALIELVKTSTGRDLTKYLSPVR